jgi:phage shock protein A
MALPLQRGSYFEQHLALRGGKPAHLEHDALIADRAKYISFLESNLERVSQITLANNALEGTVAAQAAQIAQLQDKILSLTQLIQMTHAYTERQGAEAGVAVADVLTRVAALDGRASGTEERLAALAARVQAGEATAAAHGAELAALGASQAGAEAATRALAGRIDGLRDAADEIARTAAPAAAVEELRGVLEDVTASAARAEAVSGVELACP